MFLTRLVSQDLHLRPQTWQALQQASLLADIAGHRIHGKTGSGPLVATDFSGPFEGWQVGWVDRPADAPVVYALYVAGSSYEAIARFRGEAVIMFLQTIGIVPQD